MNIFIKSIEVDTRYFVSRMQVASVINDAIKDIDPSITIISEPGQYYVTSAFTLASYVHTKRIIPRDEKMVRMYYMSCGVYNCFIEELLNFKARLPVSLREVTVSVEILKILIFKLNYHLIIQF